MKRSDVLFAVAALFISLFLCSSAWAGGVAVSQHSVFRVSFNSQLTFPGGHPLCGKVYIENKTHHLASCSDIKIMVIDPFTGDVIAAPRTTAFTATLAPEGMGGASTTTWVCSSVIPSTAANKTLAAIITVDGLSSHTPFGTTPVDIVLGVGGWGFAVTSN